MLETIFHKLMQRIQSKQKECEKWSGRICPKIKKLDKFLEWSKNCDVSAADNYTYAVKSHEWEKDYVVDMKARTCDCKRWQLSGIPCHNVIACCSLDRINPENLVHSSYTIDTFNNAYAYNLTPLRGRVFWEKINAVHIYPPLYTKVMGRPKKSRKKAPEEKMKKGVKVLTKAGVSIHCSVCGVAGHNSKGHGKYLASLQQQQQSHIIGEDEEIDIPELVQVLINAEQFLSHLYGTTKSLIVALMCVQHVIPHTPDPRLDPTNLVDNMVHKMQEQVIKITNCS